MASQPLRTYSSSRYPNKGGKTAPQEYSVEPILVPVADGALGPRKLPWATLVKAIGHFKQSIRDIRQSHMLAHFNPLATDQKLPEKQKYPMPEKKIWGDQEPLSKIPFQILTGHQQTVSSCHFCVDDTKLLSSSFDYTVKLWDAMDGSVVRDFEHGPYAPVLECSVTADSRRVAAVAYDKTLRTWDLETGKLLWKISHESFMSSCDFSPDGKYVVAGLDVDHGICITDARNAMTVSYLKDHHKKSVTRCCFGPDSQKVASVSLDKSIRIWDVTSQATLLTITKTGTESKTLTCVLENSLSKLFPRAHTNAISNCCFTFSGHFLCTSSWDKTLKIWNIHSGDFRNRGACATLMQGHEGSVSSCHFARDTSFLVSGGFDKSVSIWDIGEGYRKISLKGHDDWVMDVAISNNKKWVLSASKDKTMRLWNIEEIDQIPLVIKNRNALGLKVKQCEECDRPFSTYESDFFSETVNRCVFCRTQAKDFSTEALSSPEKDSPARGCSLGKDGNWAF